MNFYTSDLHLGHANVIKFDNRPFANVDEMDQCIITRWNERVSDEDTVYILGDVCHRNSKDSSWYLKQLRGHKILILGNHDNPILKNNNTAKQLKDKVKNLSGGKSDVAQTLIRTYIMERFLERVSISDYRGNFIL